MNPRIESKKTQLGENKAPSWELPETDSAPSLQPRSRPPVLQWFYNLPVKRKQLVGLFASEAISILGLVGVGSWLIISGGRSQLLNQAESELAITEVQYNIKIDQMGFGFRGQSDNSAIVEAVKSAEGGQQVSPQVRERVKNILRNEIRARNIEYATLVGADLRIIANANADRTGEEFNPNNWVSSVLRNPRQIKTSAIVSWSELQKESPPLPDGLAQSDIPIRYTFTPVQDPQTQAVLGVLVSGDIVKSPIVSRTVAQFKGGYSAIYAYQPASQPASQPSGDLRLVTSLEDDPQIATEPEFNVPLAKDTLLEEAVETPGEIVAGRVGVGDQTYTVAATALADINGNPVAVLVRGTPELALNRLLGNSLKLQLLVAGLAILADMAIASILGRSIVNPIGRLQKIAEKFSRGDRKQRARGFAQDEVGQLAGAFNELADNIDQQSQRQQRETERARQLNQITVGLRQSLNATQLLEAAVQGTQESLNADRALVYKFDENWQGTIVAESVVPGWPRALGARIADPCFAQDYAKLYQQGRVKATENIEQAGLTQCHLNQLKPFGVKANLVTPILVEGKLQGLLVVHQCSATRVWQEEEIDLTQQVALQIGFALEQANLFEQREQARLQAEAISTERQEQQTLLRQQLLDLLGNIEGAALGDLTVRAEVTEGEIGTVADFFNSIVENLREIVTQVKQSTLEVNASLGQNEVAISELADEALKQAEETTRTLDSVEEMTRSMQRVAQNASQAAEVARAASVTAESGGIAIERTAHNILNLRLTVTETAKKVKQLGDSSRQISKVVSLINELALQTNVLAINAGLEAARAGEEAQGFAVVANEVGQLATRSANATGEIEQILENIQRETTQVVQAMEQSTLQVTEGAHLVENAKLSLVQIVQVSRQIDELVQSISNTTVSQADTSEVVSILMQEIARVSVRTSDSSRQVSQTLRQTVEIAQKLQTSVGTFKVSAQ
ncbi:MAG: methyl-accepting chemotaxis protein [Geitlerinemataceae cyanobacterium]